ncbi:N-acetyltransferase, putative [Candida dubliniensis CD36]|uniref:N-acetyltransferase, putative n=1 Tax=Candida dubliniensis (strain CD36 / ATCC MYA-646 / CBS 7987 / NCPF 3949 / NRRL Y-17841) TaxID=573826 RepID=B9WDP7_CANDC|nr:N-acetyltransferase, putative [Candida dubliniensis CD36]CAX42803.1 N-acetyltransferase, putative [Candida dubliniensis CD36]
MIIQPNHRRKPEFNERYYICRTTEKYSTNFSIIVQYNRRVNHNLLSNALYSLIRKNSWFVQNFFQVDQRNPATTNGHNFEVRVLEQVKFYDVVKFHKIDTFDETVMESLNDHIFSMNNANLPLWRINVFEERRPNGDQFVSVSFDHSNYDGLSGVQFQKDLARELSIAKDDSFYDVLFDYQHDFENLPATILPAVDNLTDLFDLSMLSISNSILKKCVPFYNTICDYIWPSDPSVFYTDKQVTKNLQTKYKFLKLTSNQVGQISRYCRPRGLTITTYFDIICVCALQETVFSVVKSPATHTSSLVAINGRRYYSEEIKNFLYGSLVCGAPIILPTIENKLESMQMFHKQMTNDINTKKSFKSTGNLIKHDNVWEFFQNKIGKIGGRFTLTISNLGKISNSNGTFKFEQLYFISNTGVVYNFVLNITTLPNGELTAVVAYIPEFENYELNDKPIMDTFMEKFYDLLILTSS